MLISFEEIEFLKSIKCEKNEKDIDEIIAYFERVRGNGYNTYDMVYISEYYENKLRNILKDVNLEEIPAGLFIELRYEDVKSEDLEIGKNQNTDNKKNNQKYIFLEVPIFILSYYRYKRKYKVDNSNFSNLLNLHLDNFFEYLNILSDKVFYDSSKFITALTIGLGSSYFFSFLFGFPLFKNIVIRIRQDIYSCFDYYEFVHFINMFVNFSSFGSFVLSDSCSKDENLVYLLDYFNFLDKKLQVS